jgi:hypothetical protein
VIHPAADRQGSGAALSSASRLSRSFRSCCRERGIDAGRAMGDGFPPRCKAWSPSCRLCRLVAGDQAAGPGSSPSVGRCNRPARVVPQGDPDRLVAIGATRRVAIDTQAEEPKMSAEHPPHSSSCRRRRSSQRMSRAAKRALTSVIWRWSAVVRRRSRPTARAACCHHGGGEQQRVVPRDHARNMPSWRNETLPAPPTGRQSAKTRRRGAIAASPSQRALSSVTTKRRHRARRAA